MKKHLSVKINGKVQGVFFRASTQKKAQEIGVFGYVENQLDGSVLVEAEGEEEALQELLAWCRKGPDSAKVTNIEGKFSEEIKDYNDFLIK